MHTNNRLLVANRQVMPSKQLEQLSIPQKVQQNNDAQQIRVLFNNVLL
jgi:hypothetical protein